MLLTTLLLALTAPADASSGKWGPPVTYYPDAEKPKVDYFRTGGATVGVVLTEDACDGLIGKDDNCGDSADSAWGGTKAHSMGGKVTAALSPTNGGPELESGSTTTLLRQRNFLQTAAFTIGTKAADRSFTVAVSSATDKIGLVLDAESWADGTWDEATDDTYTYAIRLVRIDETTGYLELKVQGLARDADLSAVTSATLSSDSGIDTDGSTTVGMGLARTKARVKFKLGTVKEGADSEGYAYSYEIYISDTDETLSGEVTLRSDERAAGIVSSQLKQKNNGDLKHVVWTLDNEPDATHALDVAIYDAATGEDLLILDGDTPIYQARYFEADVAQAFDADPAGSAYDVTLVGYDADGRTVGSFDQTWTFTDGWNAGSELPQDASLSEGWEGTRGILNATIGGDDTLEMYAALTGARSQDIVTIEVQFNEPFEGPTPQENPLQLTFSGDFQKWVQTTELTDSQATGELEVDATFYDAEDSTVESLTWSGELDDKQSGSDPDVQAKKGAAKAAKRADRDAGEGLAIW